MDIDDLPLQSPEKNESMIVEAISNEEILNLRNQSKHPNGRNESDKITMLHKQLNFDLRVFKFKMNLIFVGQKSAKKKKFNIVQIDKNQAVHGLRTGRFFVRDRESARSDLWLGYNEVIDENGELTNKIRCRRCE